MTFFVQTAPSHTGQIMQPTEQIQESKRFDFLLCNFIEVTLLGICLLSILNVNKVHLLEDLHGALHHLW